MRVERPRRLALLGGAVVLLIVVGSAVAWGVTANRGGVDDLLPNLTQAVPDGLSGRTGGTVVAPRFFLGFQSAAANLGNGPLVVLGKRAGPEQQEMAVQQQIRRSDGSSFFKGLPSLGPGKAFVNTILGAPDSQTILRFVVTSTSPSRTNPCLPMIEILDVNGGSYSVAGVVSDFMVTNTSI